uniref:Golgi apparatus protein 1 n=1 Tax=Sinocyclocheilus grahami TaxID=75366 RepID=A0A672PJS1_SINGR
MAECGRVQQQLLLLSLWLLTVQALKPLPGFGNVRPPAAAMHQQFRAALPNPGNNAAAPAASSGSQSRRTTGWKLAEEQACRDDVTRLCPKHTWTNNLSVLECLQDKKEDTEIAADCNHLLWNYKLNLTTDPKFESVALEVCTSTMLELKECADEERGKGYLMPCLVDHRANITERQCHQYITKMTSIIFSDYRLICGFMDKCREDINTLQCGSIAVGEKDPHSQGEVIACLERALVREAEQKDNQIKDECKKAIMRVAELSADDFHLDRYLYFSCRDDRERFCENVCVGEGRVYKCLFNHKFEEAMSEKCRNALTTRQKLIAQDYKVSYSLAKACKADVRKYHCNPDTSMPRAREARLSFLLLCLESAVHRGLLISYYSCTLILANIIFLFFKKMVQDCEHRLLELQYFISRDWKLDPILYRKCQNDASRLCYTPGWNESSELMPPGAVFSCLYRHAYRTEEQGRRIFNSNVEKNSSNVQLTRDCKVEVQRILHQRALDVKLDPELQKRCMTDLGKWCSEKTDTGQELECLQDHLEELVSNCRDVVGNLTELESEDIQIEALLIRACEPVIQSHCHDVADNQIDTGNLLECLVQNKHQREMNDKCTVGVTHFQLVQMKDFRFSYKFKMACKEDVLKLCPNIKKKADVVICLSTTVRNDTLQDVKDQRVSLKCRKQLRVEELEMSEDIRLEPEMYDACKKDINKFCSSVAYGNAQIIECLKENKKQLSQVCHQKIFKLQETEMMDPELDYQLMRVCKQMIKRFCTESDAKNVLQCLKLNKNSELMDPKCKQMITKRQITQNTDYRLNPVLRKACKSDIPKFCQSILGKASDANELEGQVISCLKLKYADQIPRLCAEEAAAQEQTGQVEECLKNNLLKIKPEECKMEVLNMLKESKADIFVDPVLHTACALDLKHHCAAINPGRGRQMSCLMESLQDKQVRLQPECKRRLQDRIDMWSYAAKVAPAEGFSDLAVQVMTSPSKNYILLIIALAVSLLFLVGLLCGRITKRVTRELKDR